MIEPTTTTGSTFLSRLRVTTTDALRYWEPRRLVFRVPLKNLVDYLEGGHSLAEFLDDFPTVSHEQAVAALEEAKELLVANAHSSR